MKLEYTWKKARVGFPLQAKTVGAHFEELEKKHGGLTPQILVDDAKPTGSVLHPCFEWNDKKAAVEYRLEQARHLLRSLHVVTEIDEEGEERTIRAYFPLETDIGNEYRHIEYIVTEPDSYNEVLGRAYKELTDWKKRYEHLAEFEGIFSSITKLKPKIVRAMKKRKVA